MLVHAGFASPRRRIGYTPVTPPGTKQAESHVDGRGIIFRASARDSVRLKSDEVAGYPIDDAGIAPEALG